MERVRKDGVTLKIRRSVHEELVRILGSFASKYGKRVTYSDLIEALIRKSPDPIKALKEYIDSVEVVKNE